MSPRFLLLPLCQWGDGWGGRSLCAFPLQVDSLCHTGADRRTGAGKSKAHVCLRPRLRHTERVPCTPGSLAPQAPAEHGEPAFPAPRERADVPARARGCVHLGASPFPARVRELLSSCFGVGVGGTQRALALSCLGKCCWTSLHAPGESPDPVCQRPCGGSRASDVVATSPCRLKLRRAQLWWPQHYSYGFRFACERRGIFWASGGDLGHWPLGGEHWRERRPWLRPGPGEVGELLGAQPAILEMLACLWRGPLPATKWRIGPHRHLELLT